MQPVPVTQITIQYQADFTHLKPQDFKKGFTASFTQEMKKTLSKKNIPFDLAFNSKENPSQNQKNQKLNRYAKVQYQSKKNQFIITGIQKGASLIEIWFNYFLANNNLTFNNQKINIISIDKNTHYWYPKLQKTPQIYTIKNWKPFNSKTLANETKFDKIIWGNIHRMLTDVEVHFEQKVNIHILNYKRKKMTSGYKINWITYDLVISTNINLPQHIGIGHEVSLGSGKIIKKRLI